MPIPVPLVGASIIPVSVERHEVGDRSWLLPSPSERENLIAQCRRSLGMLEEQRDAFSVATLPRIQAAWDSLSDADEAREAFEERIGLEGGNSPDSGVGHGAVPVSAEDPPTDLAGALAEVVLLDATTAHAKSASDAIARSRLRIYGYCRRLESFAREDSDVGHWTVPQRRLLVASGWLAGTTAGLVRLSILSSDRGISRQFAGALRLLRNAG